MGSRDAKASFFAPMGGKMGKDGILIQEIDCLMTVLKMSILVWKTAVG